MPRRSFLLLLLVSASLAVAIPAAAQAAPAPGISIQGAARGAAAVTADLDQVKALGARTARMEVAWSDLEPVAAGRRDPTALSNLDAIVGAAQARGVGIILLLVSTPCWASTAPAELRDGCRPGVSSYPPSDYPAYGRLAAFLASRYRGGLAALEVWNEPDQSNEQYWAGPDKAVRYTRLVRATYPLVKAADPTLPVLAGAFVGKDGRFLQALYDAGIKGSYDGLSVHFYDLPLLGLRQTRRVQLRNRDRTPLHLLETGWNSCAPRRVDADGLPCVTRAIQDRDLRDLLAQVRSTAYLKSLVVYKLRDSVGARFGLLGLDGARKPAWAGLRSAFTGTPDRVRRPTLVLRATSRGLSVSGSAPEGDIYRLEISRNGVPRWRATFRLDARNRYSFVVPASVGTRGLRARLVSSWRGGTGTVRRA